MALTMRRYQSESDFHRILEFLRRVFLANDRREYSWQAYRFDYWRSLGIEGLGHGSLDTHVFIWETDEGAIGAVLNGEAPGNAWLQVDPSVRSTELESEMVSIAEKHMTVPTAEKSHKVRVWAHDGDRIREEVLEQHGFVKTPAVEYARRRDMSQLIPKIPVAEGYSIRSLGGDDELPARSWLSWRAFHPNSQDSDYWGWKWYPRLQQATLYRRDLDLVAVAPGGELAAFTTVWFDEVARTGAFEPVGTSPDHLRRGLASAVMREGLRRIRDLGAVLAYVGSWNEATHKLYGSLGFTDYDITRGWVKETRVGAA